MNTEQKKTLAFVLVALGLVATTALATRPRSVTSAAIAEQGQPFFPEFTDPFQAAALEVIDFDPSTASALPFKVEYSKGKGWTIPSHYDYPADAKDRLAKTAAGVIDLKKEVVVSDRPDMHEELGVLDPLDAKATSLQGRGKRVTIKAQDGKVLADLIVGKPVANRPGMRYVRIPEKPRTYATTINVDLAARFGDWIETNLLKLDSFHIDRVTIDNHKVDIERGVILPGEVVKLERTPPSGPWTMDETPPGQEVDAAKVSKLTSALAGLKIVGVRPKPEGVTKELKALSEPGDEPKKMTARTYRSLASRGFYVLPDGSIRSDQGEVIVATDEGLRYTLRFGGVTAATGEALTAGTPEEEAAKPESGQSQDQDKAKDQQKDKSAATDNRFLMVSVEFDPELVPKPASLREPAAAEPAELPEKVFARTEAEKKADEEKAKREKEDYEKKLADGRKKAEELAARFADWYYVVPGDSYRDIVVQRAALLKPKNAPASPAAGAGASPGLNLGQPPAGGDPHGGLPDSPPPIP
jgi:hypothetical protein